MLKIRLKRVGRKNDPSYRLVVVPSTTGPKSGNVLEVLGNYDPRRNVKEVNGERVKHWISEGAQVSDTVHNILVSEKVIEGKKKNVLPRKSPVKKEGEEVAMSATPSEPAGEAPVEESSVAETSQKEDPAEAVPETPAETTEPESPSEEPKEETKSE